ncbi:glycoside hydrolase family 97 protein [Aquimarina sp. U1-2]|uniref:glycoside hydrolase family 97 protein n=1 Tax=Aquimarina sp. U1-2 TaxID=2823141 RepID=UPI001AED0974|nr:glycoside hydrolase family 97 protein [Aquimarina sp. U1-2]MBP2832898.1 glycoside hydrolase family 97 protein [Aquimarina sp. U1-2]
MRDIIVYLMFAFICQHTLKGQHHKVTSPDNKTLLNIDSTDGVSFSIDRNGKKIIEKIHAALQIENKELEKVSKIKKVDSKERNTSINIPFPFKNKEVVDHFNEAQLQFSDYAIQFRVYDHAVAYRFVTSFKENIKITNEILAISFPEETLSYFPKEDSLYSHFERSYVKSKIDTLSSSDFCSMPVLMKQKNGTNILISDADVYDYPMLFLEGTSSNKLKAKFPKVVLETEPHPEAKDRVAYITKEADYIAKTKGKRTFPWRFFFFSKNEADLLTQDLVYQLSREQNIRDTSWIKPGKVAWDWYNANTIYGVNFKAGLNTATYKYYIDFASKYKLEYIILDEGWSKSTTDIINFNPDINVKEVIDYGKQKNVGVILWCLWEPLDRNMSKILKTYKEWGAKGVKVDFMQRADQEMVNFYERLAKEAAANELVLDFHGGFKPAGLRRAYPNILTYEGVRGAENNKWGSFLTPAHNVTLPFIRMAVGPMDYTPGAMENRQPKNHYISFDRPASIGTRAHQVAMYVIYESGLQMLCDSPSTYLKDQKTVDFISQIPVTWDKTIVLDAQIEEQIVLARMKNEDWYIGAMGGMEEREILLDFSFLPDGITYQATIFNDGSNANTFAEDYQITSQQVTNQTKITIRLAKGGGWTAILKSI